MRGILLIVRRSLRQHALSTAVTVTSVALATGLLMTVFSLAAQTHRAFTGGPVGFDAVLGARGSQLQLVLNTVFHLETSPGNIPYELYEEVANDPKYGVELAIPYAVGDNYRGFRMVGTTSDLFTRHEYQEGRTYRIREGGRIFEPEEREAVIGSVVALKTGLDVGDTFHAFHGVVHHDHQKHEETFTVVGIMEASNTPSDRVIWVPLETVYRMEGHVLRGEGEAYHPEEGTPIPEEHKEVSAVMLTFDNRMAAMQMEQRINKQGRVATLAWPIGTVMADLFDKMGWVVRILTLVAYLVVVVAGFSILASIYNTMNERRREFAILRALGARRRTVFSAIVCESATIALLGTALGYAVTFGIMFVAAMVVRSQTGVMLDVWALHPVHYLTPAGMILVGAAAGTVPAWKAYRTDVATNLIPTS